MAWELFISTFAQFICSFVLSLLLDLTLDSECTYGSNAHITHVLVMFDLCWRLPAIKPAHRILALDVTHIHNLSL